MFGGKQTPFLPEVKEELTEALQTSFSYQWDVLKSEGCFKKGALVRVTCELPLRGSPRLKFPIRRSHVKLSGV